jgi:hypothetical protein
VALGLFLFVLYPFTCNVHAGASNFLAGVAVGTVTNPALNEVSGLIGSRQNRGVLWVHNDSGDKPRLFALNPQGRVLGIYNLSGASHVDWEDIAVAPDPVSGVHYIYVGDIGDNNAVRPNVTVYRVEEPSVTSTQAMVEASLSVSGVYHFTYPDGARDVETLMVDPHLGDVYFLSKREFPARLYSAPYPLAHGQTNALTFERDLYLVGPVAGAFAPSGREVLVLEYNIGISYFERAIGQHVADALDVLLPLQVPYVGTEPQGEAVGWEGEGRGYYTLSERVNQPLYFYAGTDDDGDGLTDSQELMYGSDTSTPDSDGDTQSDGAEALVGSDPTNSRSRFTAVLSSSTAGVVQLEWMAQPGVLYDVEEAGGSVSNGPFSVLARDLVVASEGVFATSVTHTASDNAFLVRARRP